VVPGDQAVDLWIDSPRIRETLERWGMLEKDSPRSAVHEKLSLSIAKLNVRSDDPLNAILDHVEQRPTDLIVLATEGRSGLPRWVKKSVAEGIARHAKTMTLFVRHGVRGFVSPQDGTVAIRRILVPVDHTPRPAPAVVHAARAAVMSRHPEVEIDLLRVGDEEWPPLELPELASCKWNRIHREGRVVDQIAAIAQERETDLIVMATSGAKGILGALRGSVTEQVLRRSPCVLLAVPERAV
jgi:nucleotide-binding universal stress UspA family protein